jgi:AAA15 family ATPase/GTPase
MLDSLYIKNFRLFKELKIENLGRVNLILGRNNSGKSCLLEALHLYAKNASPRTLYELIMARGEDWEILKEQENDEPTLQVENPLRHLFYGYHFPDLNNGGDIEIGSVKETQERLKLHIHAYQTITTEEKQIFARVDDKQAEFFDNEDTELVIEIEIANKIKSRVRLNEIEKPRKYPIRRMFPYRLSSNAAKLNIQVVPTKHINDENVATLWDNINVQPFLRKIVFKGLQLIDKNIQEVVLVGRGKNTMPILIYKNGEKQIPLKSLGDGMTHLFHIILALVNAKDGFLLIDEFENGLHYTVQPKVWELIFKLAKELNVQVFATTHSKDCVEGFHAVWETQEDAGTLHRLDNNLDDGVSVMPYTCELIAYALESDGEIR